MGISVKGGAAISQEVRPEDKMATDSQNGDIIVPSPPTVNIISGFLVVQVSYQVLISS
jgi:hypothetical protein